MSWPNMTWRSSPALPSRVFSTKLPFLRFPIHPQGHIAISPCSSQAGVRVAVCVGGGGSVTVGAGSRVVT